MKLKKSNSFQAYFRFDTLELKYRIKYKRKYKSPSKLSDIFQYIESFNVNASFEDTKTQILNDTRLFMNFVESFFESLQNIEQVELKQALQKFKNSKNLNEGADEDDLRKSFPPELVTKILQKRKEASESDDISLTKNNYKIFSLFIEILNLRLLIFAPFSGEVLGLDWNQIHSFLKLRQLKLNQNELNKLIYLSSEYFK